MHVSMQPAPWMRITDTRQFVSTQLTQLGNACPLLSRQAEKRLKAFIKHLPKG